MNISTNYNSINFRAKFINNKAFADVINYASKENKLMDLDTALHRLKVANEGDIMIIHGQVPEGIYSNFRMKNRSVQNIAAGCSSPAEATFNSIIELSNLGKKFKRLIGGEVKTKTTTLDIVNEYGVNEGPKASLQSIH